MIFFNSKLSVCGLHKILFTTYQIPWGRTHQYWCPQKSMFAAVLMPLMVYVRARLSTIKYNCISTITRRLLFFLQCLLPNSQDAVRHERKNTYYMLWSSAVCTNNYSFKWQIKFASSEYTKLDQYKGITYYVFHIVSYLLATQFFSHIFSN